MSGGRVQLVCPVCRHEFNYNNGEMDARIHQLSIEVADIIAQLAAHKRRPWNEQVAATEWWRGAKLALARRQRDLARLKAERKLCNEQRDVLAFRAWKNAVKELYGEEGHAACLALVEELMEGYRVEGMAKRAFSAKGGKGVTSAGKL